MPSSPTGSNERTPYSLTTAMSSNSTHEFPTPVGGAPISVDFAPSILFSALYGLLFPLAVYRAVRRDSRNTVLIGTLVFATEHIVLYALRAHVAHSASARGSEGLETYFQTTLSAGFISIGQDISVLLRALLVSSTFTTPSAPAVTREPPAATSSRPPGGAEMEASDRDGTTRSIQEGDSTKHLFPPSAITVSETREDQPALRLQIRNICGVVAILFLVTVILSIVAGVDYNQALKSGAHAELSRQLMYASTGLAVGLLIMVACGASYAVMALPRVPKGPAMYPAAICILLTVVGIYRLSVLHNTTTSLLSTGPGSFSSPGAKATFYVFHAAPEWIAAALVLSVNVRKVYKTGMFGDFTSDKPQPE
ncbi:hypothetical protein C8Q78DRAFT_189491 [Trametes maxima]|nr:hypothetical protein C8Q78DRAFT_189491 [Trametes maxima]